MTAGGVNACIIPKSLDTLVPISPYVLCATRLFFIPAFQTGFSPLLVALLVAGAVSLVLSVLASIRYQRHRDSSSHQIQLELDDSTDPLMDSEQERQSNLFKSIMMSGFTPCSLAFDRISYSVPAPMDAAAEKTVLHGIRGAINPGEVLALLGGSGAGKTSLLDILAKRNKSGSVSGRVWVNEKVCVSGWCSFTRIFYHTQILADDVFKSVIGYVDQTDTLMETLTVFETVLYSARLRLPHQMPLEAKKSRVRETMQELGISGIANSMVKAISGGEKRRVSIACELVTSPSILFLDEPTYVSRSKHSPRLLYTQFWPGCLQRVQCGRVSGLPGTQLQANHHPEHSSAEIQHFCPV